MKIAACLMVRDEAGEILQWLAFHHLAGFDTFVVLDHRSSDGTAAETARARAFADVRISRLEKTGPGLQEAAFLAVCRATAAEFDWIAFIDADEYLVGRDDPTVRALCEANAGSAAIAVPWRLFGSSGHVEKPAALTIEAFTRRAPAQFKPNQHVKSIVRPAAVRACLNAHCFDVDGATVLPDGAEVVWEKPGRLATVREDAAWLVHHYFTRSRAHWSERLARGQLGGFVRKPGEFAEYDRNEVEDLRAARRAGAVRALLARLGKGAS